MEFERNKKSDKYKFVCLLMSHISNTVISLGDF